MISCVDFFIILGVIFMKMNFVKNMSVLLSLFAATFAHASLLSNQVPCPSVSTVSQTATKIDAAEESNGSYIVYTSTPAFNESNLPWYVGVVTDLDSAEEAFKQGKEDVQNINTLSNENAYDDGNGHFICLYKPGYVVAVGGDLGQQPTLFKRH
jgi:hypothetical protein